MLSRIGNSCHAVLLMLLFAPFSVLLDSCSNQETVKDFAAIWTVDSVKYNSEEYSLHHFLANMIFFEQDNTCSFPVRDRNETENGIWEILSSADSTLKVTFGNNMFSGIYKIRVVPKTNYSPEQMVLRSEMVTVYCSLVARI